MLCTNWEYYQYSNLVPPQGTKFIHQKSYIHMKQLELKKKILINESIHNLVQQISISLTTSNSKNNDKPNDG